MATPAERHGQTFPIRSITTSPISRSRSSSTSNPGTNTQIVEPANTAYPQFPNNIIPQSLISPTGQKILNLQPLPNIPINGLGENYAVFRSVRNQDNRYLARIDQVITSNNRLSFRVAQVPTQGLRFNQGGLIEQVPEDKNTGTNAMLSDTLHLGRQQGQRVPLRIQSLQQFAHADRSAAIGEWLPDVRLSVLPHQGHAAGRRLRCECPELWQRCRQLRNRQLFRNLGHFELGQGEAQPQDRRSIGRLRSRTSSITTTWAAPGSSMRPAPTSDRATRPQYWEYRMRQLAPASRPCCSAIRRRSLSPRP